MIVDFSKLQVATISKVLAAELCYHYLSNKKDRLEKYFLVGEKFAFEKNVLRLFLDVFMEPIFWRTEGKAGAAA